MPSRLRNVLAAGGVALAASLCGCAIFTETYGIQEVENWAGRNEPLAEAGEMRWSEFYSRYLEKVVGTPVIGQGPVVETLGIMVTASLFYERGRIDKADFESIRGIVHTYGKIDDAAANFLAREALVKAMERPERGP